MSAAIRNIHYKPADEELSIWFWPDGRRYKYFGVPDFIYEGLRDAESRGRFFNESIKGRFECRRVEPEDRRKPRRPPLRTAS
ncbi:MAG TPA: KTSC domain-containing protein [Devosia sp.]|jgi:hypothetical protein|uniref:KTSC domain-containing protein n=1 Tax=Devosia sp. TaxID=1871048 RepID=UPI002F94A1D8